MLIENKIVENNKFSHNCDFTCVSYNVVQTDELLEENLEFLGCGCWKRLRFKSSEVMVGIFVFLNKCLKRSDLTTKKQQQQNNNNNTVNSLKLMRPLKIQPHRGNYF